MAAVSRSFQAGRPIAGMWVRPEKKDHGHQKRIEGFAPAGGCLVLVDDVMTTGGSTLKCLDVVKEEIPDIRIYDAIAVVDRGEGGRELLESRGVRMHSLVTIAELFEIKNRKAD
jgi:orotate phosphoribosyltransferase